MKATPDQPARILIVDDERKNRDVLEAMLQPEGFQLLHAASGAEALVMAAQQRPGVVLLDVMMPDMDGYQVAVKLKGDPATRDIPIMMITALDNRDARMAGMSAGVDRFISKPVDRAELLQRVKDLLSLKS